MSCGEHPEEIEETEETEETEEDDEREDTEDDENKYTFSAENQLVLKKMILERINKHRPSQGGFSADREFIKFKQDLAFLFDACCENRERLYYPNYNKVYVKNDNEEVVLSNDFQNKTILYQLFNDSEESPSFGFTILKEFISFLNVKESGEGSDYVKMFDEIFLQQSNRGILPMLL